VPPYLKKYTRDERAAYLAAVDDYQRFAGRNATFYRVGKATPAARNYYMRATSAWQSYWAKLRQFESRGIRVLGKARTIRMRPGSVRLLKEGGGEVDLRICASSKGVRVIQQGEEVPQPGAKPVTVLVQMVLLRDESTWRILSDRVGPRC